MVNIWGYSHLNFFAPMSRFGGAPPAAGACPCLPPTAKHWLRLGLARPAPPPPPAANGAGPLAAAREFKEMVRALHAEGIEVIIDVVYNHTVEGGWGQAGRQARRSALGAALGGWLQR